jgi:protein-tyrosine-phosphatase
VGSAPNRPLVPINKAHADIEFIAKSFTHIPFIEETTLSAKPLNVLFLCTHNSARSILAEATLNHIGGGRFNGFSAGSSPRENQQPNPIGLQTLRNAAGKVCPFWPGKPATAHWGYADPSAGDGSDEQKAEAFKNTLHAIRRRLDLLVNLPDEKLDAMVLQRTAKELATA